MSFGTENLTNVERGSASTAKQKEYKLGHEFWKLRDACWGLKPSIHLHLCTYNLGIDHLEYLQIILVATIASQTESLILIIHELNGESKHHKETCTNLQSNSIV